jgi:hypothetical protein
MMSQTQVEVEGTLQPDGTLLLDEKPNLPPGRVRVVLQHRAIQSSAPPENLFDFVQRIHHDSTARGHRFLSDEEMAAWIDELRADDDRIAQAYRAAEEHRQQEQLGC